ncbi:MAG TPA: hypothetical protein VGH95_06780 [Candidatus Aquirickettsiella sp.]|jgi:hypothetical protein
MNLENANQALQEYKKQLNKISIDDAEYKMLLSSAASNFFGKVKKLYRNFLIDYFNYFNKEIFVKDKVQEDAFNYLFLLVIKNTKTYEIFRDFFPSYLKPVSIQSNWLVIRWLKNFLYWLLKPKLKLKDFQGAINLLNAIRNIKDRIEKKEMHNLYQEIAEFKSLAIVVNELGKSTDLHKIYIPINEDNSLEENQNFFENQLSSLTKQEIRETLDISYLMQCNSEGLTFFNGKNMYLKQNIHHREEGIRKRLLLLGANAKTTASKINLNPLTSEFKQLLSLNIGQIQFFYEAFNKNLAKQNQQFYYGNTLELYQNLNKLGEILYQDKNLFFHSINQASTIDYIIDLSGTLDTLRGLAEFLKSIAKEIDPKTLEEDILKLSEHILLYLSVIKENLRPYTENTDFIMRSISCRNPSSNSENKFTSEVVSLDSEREKGDYHLDRDYPDQALYLIK